MADTRITSDNATALVKIVTWLLLSFTSLAIIGRLAVKLLALRNITADDWLLLAGFGFNIAESVAATVAAENGLGKHQQSLSAPQLAHTQKSIYAAGLLYIPSICLAKLSVLSYLWAVTPVKKHRRWITALACFTIAWCVSAELVSAFQCSVPQTWETATGKCINQMAFARYMDVLNIATELLIILLPTAMILSLQMTWRRKFDSISIFALRASVIVSAACQIAFSGAVRDVDDATAASWPYFLCRQVTQCVCLMATCALYSRAFLDAVQSGMIRIDDVRGYPAGYSSDRYQQGSGITLEAFDSKKSTGTEIHSLSREAPASAA